MEDGLLSCSFELPRKFKTVENVTIDFEEEKVKLRHLKIILFFQIRELIF